MGIQGFGGSFSCLGVVSFITEFKARSLLTLIPMKLFQQNELGVRSLGLINLLVLRAITESGMNFSSDTVTESTE